MCPALFSKHAYVCSGAFLFSPTPLVSLHVALQLNWILVAALEDYHAETPDGSKNKKANTVYFNRCAKLLQVCRTAGSILVRWGGIARAKGVWYGGAMIRATDTTEVFTATISLLEQVEVDGSAAGT